MTKRVRIAPVINRWFDSNDDDADRGTWTTHGVRNHAAYPINSTQAGGMWPSEAAAAAQHLRAAAAAAASSAINDSLSYY